MRCRSCLCPSSWKTCRCLSLLTTAHARLSVSSKCWMCEGMKPPDRGETHTTRALKPFILTVCWQYCSSHAAILIRLLVVTFAPSLLLPGRAVESLSCSSSESSLRRQLSDGKRHTGAGENGEQTDSNLSILHRRVDVCCFCRVN